MRQNKHLLLWTSLVLLGTLIWAAVDENFLRDWRRAQREARGKLAASERADLPSQVRQIVLAETGAVERCVSCHVGMALDGKEVPGDKVFGRHPNVIHDPARFGCTVCHGGQGTATLLEEAHGTAPHCPEALLPKRYAYASCGSCHAYQDVPARAGLETARAVFERSDCLACHRMDGRGGTMRPGGAGGLEGPALSRVGMLGYAPDWYAGHQRKKAAASSGPWRSSMPELTDEERRSLSAYLRTAVGAPGLVLAKSLFLSRGCLGCHKVGGAGGDDGPDLTAVGRKDPVLTPYARVRGPRSLENWFKDHFRSPGRVVQGSKMPLLSLDEREADELTFFLFSLRRADLPMSLWPKDRLCVERLGGREFASDGETLFGAFCSGCHGSAGQGRSYPGLETFPAVANPSFLKLASDRFLADTIRRGRPGRRMPSWGAALSDADIAELVKTLRRFGDSPFAGDSRPARWARGDARRGASVFQADCAGCHGPHGAGGTAPALDNQVFLEGATDSYLFRTVKNGRQGTVMKGFGAGSPGRRTLSDAEIEDIISHLRSWRKGK
ncbi:MAG: c-type cytochrome [Elusimicrobia bacterium]|nr:c-type cytochrome [Elusimicrobiota bacterium]